MWLDGHAYFRAEKIENLIMRPDLVKIFIFFTLATTGCAYYNTFFNAQKYFGEAERERNRRLENIKKKGQMAQPGDNKLSSSELKKYDNSIEKASKVLELYPKSKYVDDALFLLGKCFYRKEEYDKAKRKFVELIENFPTSAFVSESQLWLAKTNIELRDYETAEKNFHNILRSDADDKIRDEAQFLLGGLFKHKGDYITAIDEYNTAAKRAKDKSIRANAYYEMGDSYYQLKNFAKAVESFKAARKYSPDTKFEFNTMLRAGLALKDLQKYDDAIKIFTNLLGDAINEENWPTCRLEIAHCNRLKGEIDNASGWYLDIVNQHPKTEEAATAYFYLGKIYQEEKAEYGFAKEYYDKAVSENSRALIVNEARAHSKSIQTYLALKTDIEAQKRKVARGDSIAASMDSLDVNTSAISSLEEPDLDSLHADPDRVFPDTLDTPDDSLYQTQKEDESGDPRRKGLEDLQNKNNQKKPEKLALKTGELGTPHEELIKDKLLLAEIYLFEFNQPDSALKEYIDILEIDTSGKVIPKALFSIGYICETFKQDTLLADTVYQRLITDYPENPFAKEARQKIRTIKITNPDAALAQKFRTAEIAYLDKHQYNDALATFDSIYQSSPSSEYAPKALMAMGWIYENNFQQSQKAFEIYQSLVDNYPATVYAQKIKPKVDAVIKARSSSEAEKEILSGEHESLLNQELNRTSADTTQMADISGSDREQYRRMLRQEMQKNDPRRKTPRRW